MPIFACGWACGECGAATLYGPRNGLLLRASIQMIIRSSGSPGGLPNRPTVIEYIMFTHSAAGRPRPPQRCRGGCG